MNSPFSFCCVLALLPGLICAQQPDSARRPADTTATTLAPVRVRASIAPTAGRSVGSGIPAQLTTIDSLAIERMSPRTAAEVLGGEAGISLYDDLGSPYKLNLQLRGFAAGPTVGLPGGISVFLDGIRQNEPDAQEVNFDLLPIEDVERIELLKGNASLLGPNSLAGAINLVTRRGEGARRGEIEVSGGSFGALDENASISGATKSGWDYYGAGGYGRERGWRDATDANSYNTFLNVGRDVNDHGILFQALTARSRAETAGSLPESIFEVSPRENFTPGDFEDLTLQQLSASAYAPVKSVRSSLAIYARHSHADRFNVNQPPDDNVRGVTNNWTVGGNTDWRWSGARGADADVAVRFGLETSESIVRVQLFTEPQSSSGTRDLTTDVRSPRLDAAGYFVADTRWRKLAISMGSRFDYVRVPFQNRADTLRGTANRFTAWTPRAGVSLGLGGGVNAYTSVGRSFRAPAILELACADATASCPLPFALGEDPPLAPVAATTYEVGARWLVGPALLTASAFRANVHHEIFFIASDSAPLSGYFTNLDRTRRQGIELSSRVSLLSDRLSLNGSFALTQAAFRTSAQIFSIRSDAAFVTSRYAGSNAVRSGDRVPLVPGNQLNVGGDLRVGGGTQVGVSARYVGRQWLRGDEANETTPLHSYHILDARLSRSVHGWGFSVVVTNLLDSRAANFGTYNVNRRTNELEQFLTPVSARQFRFSVSRALGHSRPAPNAMNSLRATCGGSASALPHVRESL